MKRRRTEKQKKMLEMLKAALRGDEDLRWLNTLCLEAGYSTIELSKGECWVTAPQLAMMMDVSKSTIYSWIKYGLPITRETVRGARRINLRLMFDWIKNKRLTKREKNSKAEGSVYWQQRVREETARKLKMANDLKEGTLSETKEIADYLLIIARSAKSYGERLERAHGRKIGDDIREFHLRLREDCERYAQRLSKK